MNKKIANFAKFYSKISSLGPSRTQSKSHKENYFIPFDDEMFYDKLYVDLPLEKVLHEDINSPFLGEFLAVCGPSSSGKSTVSRKVKDELEKEVRNLIFFFDMRVHHSSKDHDESDNENDDISSEINKKQLRNLMLGKFANLFPIIDGKREDLFYYILSPNKDIKKKRDFEFFGVFSEERDAIEFAFLLMRENSDSSFEDWFNKNSNSPELIKIKQNVSKKLDVQHYLAYIKYKNLYDKIVIWLDNVDAFTNEQQILISGFLQDIQKSIINFCQLVISVREENIFRIGDFDDNKTEPFVSIVSFEDPELVVDKSDLSKYDALNLPIASYENLIRIVEKKNRFCLFSL